MSGLLLAAIVAATISTVAMFLGRARDHAHGTIMWSRRLLFAVGGTVLVAAGAAGVAYLIDDRAGGARLSFVLLLLASGLWLPATRRWNARAHLCWSTNVYLYGVYLVYMLDWTLHSPLGDLGLAGALALWALEVLAALLGCAYLWELCDAMGSEQWRRRVADGVEPERAAEAGVQPFVSLHVPAYEEPPEMVIETLESLRRLDYDNYEIIAIDDNTTDESLWRPVEAWCAANGVKFVHLEDWPGYKSGALNHALRELTHERAELIGVVDSDYQLEPDFLARCAPLFADPEVGFMQAPQDYRDWEGAPFYRRLYYSYKYFFSVSQPSRNERDGAIFAGTMGLIRRQALEDVGGWDEWCITEDAELSLRVLRAGWSGIHVDASFGHGVMPLTFEALKGQRFRWCFGGIQILRMHWRSLLPGPRRRSNRLTTGQRWAYLSGGLQWYGDLVGLLFFFFLLGGAANLALGGGLLFRKLSPFLLGVIPVLVLLGFLRAVALIRRGTGATWADAMGAFLIWQSTTLVVARASVQGLFARKAEFLRTPKTGEGLNLWRAVSANKGEVLLAVLGLAGIVVGLVHLDSLGGVLTTGLLVLPTIAFASAPANSIAAQRAALPDELAARRRLESRRALAVRGSTAAATVGIVAVAALVLALIAPGGEDVRPPSLVRPERTPSQAPGQTPTQDPTSSPSGASPGSPGGQPSAIPTGPAGSPSETGSPAPSGSPQPSTTGSPSGSPTGTATGSPSTAPSAAPTSPSATTTSPSPTPAATSSASPSSSP